jgi:hypothetical protein
MYIKVSELKKGDEILVPAGANLLHCIVLKEITHTENPKWCKSVKLSILGKRKEIVSRHWRDGTTYTWHRSEYSQDLNFPERFIRYIDLNYKMIWLLNRQI